MPATSRPTPTRAASQPRRRLRADDQLWTGLGALGVAIVLGVIGATIGLVDDRLSYRRSPRFESFLRERPSGVPSDPWNQPVVPLDDLGRRLPDVEWREVRVTVAAGLAALVLLPLLCPWSAVSDALGQFAPQWVALGLVLVAATYPVATLGLLGADAFPTLLVTSVAASFTGRLLPEYGPQGLAVHQLVKAGASAPGGRPPAGAARRGCRVGPRCAPRGAAARLHAGIGGGGCRPRVVVGGLGGGGRPARGGVFTARRRYRNLVIRPTRQSFRDLLAARSEPSTLAVMVGSCLGLALLDGLVVVASVQAFGGGGSLVAILLASLVATAAGVLSPTPDGEGAVEAVLVLGLIWAGVDAGPAVAAALLARILRFWLPMLPGYVALRRLQDDGVL